MSRRVLSRRDPLIIEKKRRCTAVFSYTIGSRTKEKGSRRAEGSPFFTTLGERTRLGIENEKLFSDDPARILRPEANKIIKTGFVSSLPADATPIVVN